MLRFDSALQLFERTATARRRGRRASRSRPARRSPRCSARPTATPAVFADADAFDVGRDPNPHLAFGAGVHFCLGAPLARMELAESLSLLARTFPGLRLAGEPERRPTFVLRGLRVGAGERHETASVAVTETDGTRRTDG